MNQPLQTLELTVKGMSCAHCVRAVTAAVRQQDPQADVRVDLQQGRVSVTSRLGREDVAQALRGEGYEVGA